MNGQASVPGSPSLATIPPCATKNGVTGVVVPFPPCGQVIVAVVVSTCGMRARSRDLELAGLHADRAAAPLDLDRLRGVAHRDLQPAIGLDHDLLETRLVLEAELVAAG